MRTSIRNALLATALVSLGVLAAPAVGAQAPPPTMTVDPTTLTFGTQLTVSGDGCVDPDTGDGDGLSVLVEGRSLQIPNPDDPQGQILGLANVAADGSWSLEYRVPGQSGAFDPTEDFTRNIQGTCGDFDPAATLFEYPEVPVRFEVPDATTTTSSSTTGTSVPAGPAPGPAPASPVSGTATFTG